MDFAWTRKTANYFSTLCKMSTHKVTLNLVGGHTVSGKLQVMEDDGHIQIESDQTTEHRVPIPFYTHISHIVGYSVDEGETGEETANRPL